jgi:hypothetical protein
MQTSSHLTDRASHKTRMDDDEFIRNKHFWQAVFENSLKNGREICGVAVRDSRDIWLYDRYIINFPIAGFN